MQKDFYIAKFRNILNQCDPLGIRELLGQYQLPDFYVTGLLCVHEKGVLLKSPRALILCSIFCFLCVMMSSMPKFGGRPPPLALNPVVLLLIWILIYMFFLSSLLFLQCSKSQQMAKLKYTVAGDSSFTSCIPLLKSNLTGSKSVYSLPTSFYLQWFKFMPSLSFITIQEISLAWASCCLGLITTIGRMFLLIQKCVIIGFGKFLVAASALVRFLLL